MDGDVSEPSSNFNNPDSWRWKSGNTNSRIRPAFFVNDDTTHLDPDSDQDPEHSPAEPEPDPGVCNFDLHLLTPTSSTSPFAPSIVMSINSKSFRINLSAIEILRIERDLPLSEQALNSGKQVAPPSLLIKFPTTTFRIYELDESVRTSSGELVSFLQRFFWFFLCLGLSLNNRFLH